MCVGTDKMHCFFLLSIGLAWLGMMAAINITTDQLALLSLRDHVIISEPHDILENNWSVTSSVCDWMGVTCGSRHRRVTALNISNMNLIGTLPPQLGNLSFLVSLDISRNNFHGELPPDLARLRRLRYLDFGVNNFGGKLPSWFGYLQKLHYLSLRNNSFAGLIPTSISNMSNLETLWLSFNSIEGNIPTEFQNLYNLKKLAIEYNQLSGSLPRHIFNISSMEVMSFTSNSLSGTLPDNICHGLKKLTWLSLALNNLTGHIPSTLSQCSLLQTLSWNFNHFTGSIPKEMGNLTRLEILYLGANNLRGVIPHEIWNLTMLRALDFRGNFLTGIATSVIAVTVAVLVLRCRKKQKVPGGIQLLTVTTCVRFSYYDLLQSTNDFSESNLLGIGSFGSVYRGVLNDGASVAVKVFNLQLEGAFKSFDTECEVLRNLRHRNLTKVIGNCSSPDFKALILHYMPNGNLEKWLYSYNQFLDLIQRVDIMIDVACALEYLHFGYTTPVVHCDLKPSNILLDEDMVAHVSDFGIAKMFGEGESVLQTNTLATMGYIAPEYGSEGLVSTSIDVYGFGIILMETFSRMKPSDEMFSGDLSLKSWVEDSLPNVLQVIDANLVRPEDEHFSDKLEFLILIMKLALNCCAERPGERISMKDALAGLKKIKHQFLMKVIN